MGSDEIISTGSARPVIPVNDADLLLNGEFIRSGFDLIIIAGDGRELVISDYFAFNPPPNLMLPGGAGLNHEMVKALLHEPLGDTLFAGPATGSAEADAVGTVRFAYGKVFRIDGDKNKIALTRGDKLFEGDEVVVEGRGYIRARMEDGTRFNLGANGRAIIDNYAFDEAAKVGNFEATVLRGGFHYESGKIGAFGGGRDHSKIKTPTAIIGIRGSELDGVVQEDGSTTVIHRSGILTVTDIDGNNPVSLTFPGHTSVIQLRGGPSFVTEPSDEQLQEVEGALPPPGDPGEADEPPPGESGEDEPPPGDPETDGTQGSDPVLSNASDIEPSIDGEGTDPNDNPILEDEVVVGDLDFEPGTITFEEVTLGDPATSPEQELPPLITLTARPDAFGLNEDAVLIGLAEAILSNDINTSDDPLVIAAVDDSALSGSLIFSAENQTLSYVASGLDSLAAGETRVEQFTYRVTADDDSSTGTVSLTVTGVNDAPLANPDELKGVLEGASASLNVVQNDFDIDNIGDLRISDIVAVDAGQATISADGLSIVFATPTNLSEGEQQEILVKYLLSDGSLTSESFATFFVTGVNDAPVVNVNANAPTAITLGIGPIDITQAVLATIDDDSELLEIVGLNTVNTLGNVFLGSVYYDPGEAFDFLAEGETFVDTFGFTVQDEQGLTGTGQFSLLITGVANEPDTAPLLYVTNDSPVRVQPDINIVSEGNLQNAGVGLDGDLIETNVRAVADTGATNVPFSGDPILDVLVLVGTPLVIDRSDFSVTENVFLFDDDAGTVTIEGVLTADVDQADSFQVNVQAGETLVLDIDGGEDFGADRPLALNIYQAFTNTHLLSVEEGGVLDRGSFNSDDPFLFFTPTSSGTFTVVVSDAALVDGFGNVTNGVSNTADYTLQMSIISDSQEFSSNEPTIISESGLEPTRKMGDLADELDSAIQLSRSEFTRGTNLLLGLDPADLNFPQFVQLPNVTILGDLSADDRSDFFKVELKAGDELTLDIDFADGSFRSIDTKIEVFAPGDNIADTPAGIGPSVSPMVDPGSESTDDPFFTYTAAADGVYTFQIKEQSDFPRDGDYVLHATLDAAAGPAGFDQGRTVLDERSSDNANFRPIETADILNLDIPAGFGVFEFDDLILLFGDATPAEYSDILASATYENLAKDLDEQGVKVEFFGVGEDGEVFRADVRDIETESNLIDLRNPEEDTFLSGDVHSLQDSYLSRGDINGDGFDDLLVNASDGNLAYAYGVLGGTQSLNSQPVVTFTYDNFGDPYFYDAQTQSLRHAGDFNGDGFDDMLVTFTYESMIGNTLPEHYIVFGSANIDDAPIQINTINDSNVGIQFVTDRIEAVGDINGDGYDDLMLYDNGNNDSTLVLGGNNADFNPFIADPQDVALALAPGTPDNHFLSINTYVDLFPNRTLLDYNDNSPTSYGMRAAGDINGDGYDDLLVTLTANNEAAVTYVLFGRDTEALIQHSDQVDRLMGDQLFVNEGESIAIIDSSRGNTFKYSQAHAVGDVNGDGYDDLSLTLIPKYGGVAEAGTYIIYGGPTLLDFAQDIESPEGVYVTDLLDGDGTYGFKLTSSELQTEFDAAAFVAAEVVAVGDVNGDGYADMLVTPYLSDELADTPNNDDADRAPAEPVYGDAVLVFGGPQLNPDGTGSLAVDQISQDQGIILTDADLGIQGEDIHQAGAGDFNGDGFADFVTTIDYIDPFAVSDGNALSNIETGNQLINGQSDSDTTLVGSDADDAIDVGAGILSVSTGAGDDVIRLSPQQVIQVNGGGGIDTVEFNTAGVSVQLDTLALKGIEAIDLGNTNNTLTVDLASIRALDNGDHFLVSLTGTADNFIVLGTASDAVATRDNGWVEQSPLLIPDIGTNFAHYIKDGVSLLVEIGVNTAQVREGLGAEDQFLGTPFDNIPNNMGTIDLVSGAQLTRIDGQLVSNNSLVTLASGAVLKVLDTALGTFEYDPTNAFEQLKDGELGHDQFTFTQTFGGVDDDTTFYLSFGNTIDDPTEFTPGAAPEAYNPPVTELGRIQVFGPNAAAFDPDSNFLGGYDEIINIGDVYMGGATGYFFIDADFLPDDVDAFFGSNISIGGDISAAALEAILPNIYYVVGHEDTIGNLTLETRLFEVFDSATFTHTITINAQSVGLNPLKTLTHEWAAEPDLFKRGAASLVPTLNDDVNLLGGGGPTLNISDGQPAFARNLYIDKSGLVLNVHGILEVANEFQWVDGTYLNIEAQSGPAEVHATSFIVGNNTSVTNETIKMFSNGPIAAAIFASEQIQLNKVTLELTPNALTAVELNAPVVDLRNADIHFMDPGDLLIQNSPNGEINLPVSVIVDQRTHFEGDIDTNRVVMNRAFFTTDDTFVFSSTNNDADSPFEAPEYVFQGTTIFGGGGDFINQRSDLSLGNFTLNAGTTLHNEGFLTFTGTVTINGQLVNNNTVTLSGANVTFNEDYESTFADLSLTGSPSSITAANGTMLNIDSYLGVQGTGHVIDGDVRGPAFLNLNGNGSLTFNNDGHLLDLSGTAIDADSATLIFDGGNLIITSDTTFDTNSDSIVRFENGVRVTNGGQSIMIDQDNLILEGLFEFGVNTLEFLTDKDHGDLREQLIGETLDFYGEVEIENDSNYRAEVNESLGQFSQLNFDRVRLDGRLSPNVAIPGLATAGEMFIVLSALHMEESFAAMDSTPISMSPGDIRFLTPVYDYTEGAATVSVQVVQATQEFPGDNGKFNGTDAADVIFTTDSSAEFLKLSSGDIAYAYNASFAQFEVTSSDFGRLIGGQVFGTNILKLAATSLDVTQLQGTQLENISNIQFADDAAGQQLTLDPRSIDQTLDDHIFQQLFIQDDSNVNDGDKVILIGDFRGFVNNTETFFFSDGPVLNVENSLLVEVRHDDGSRAFYGTNGADILIGTPGDDLFIGGDGADEYQAGAGNDEIEFSTTDAGQLVDAGSGTDILFAENQLINFSSLDLSGHKNFEIVEIRGGGGLYVDFDDLFGGGGFLDPAEIDLFSNDAAHGDHQLLVKGDGDGVTFRFDGVDIGADNGGMAAQLAAAGISQGPSTVIEGELYVAFTKANTTIFLDNDMFQDAGFV